MKDKIEFPNSSMAHQRPAATMNPGMKLCVLAALVACAAAAPSGRAARRAPLASDTEESCVALGGKWNEAKGALV